MLLYLSHPSNTCPLVSVTLEAAICHTVYTFVQSAPPENIHCDESLVWVKTSDLWVPSSLNLHKTPLGYLTIAPSHRNLAGIVLWDQSFHVLQ